MSEWPLVTFTLLVQSSVGVTIFTALYFTIILKKHIIKILCVFLFSIKNLRSFNMILCFLRHYKNKPHLIIHLI